MGTENWGTDVQNFVNNLSSDPDVVTATGTASISSVIGSPETNKYWKIVSVDIHFSTAVGTGTLTIRKNASSGSAFDTLLVSEIADTMMDFCWVPDSESPVLKPGDTVDIGIVNSAGVTYGLTVLTKTWKG